MIEIDNLILVWKYKLYYLYNLRTKLSMKKRALESIPRIVYLTHHFVSIYVDAIIL